jgi:hypothetical protein
LVDVLSHGKGCPAARLWREVGKLAAPEEPLLEGVTLVWVARVPAFIASLLGKRDSIGVVLEQGGLHGPEEEEGFGVLKRLRHNKHLDFSSVVQQLRP